MSKLLISALALGICSFGMGQGAAPAKPAVAPLEDASAFMQRVKEKLGTSTTVSGTLEVTAGKKVQEIKFKAMRPNLISLVMPEFELHGAGKGLVMYAASAKMYMSVPATEEGHMLSVLVGFEPVMGVDPPFTVSGKTKPTFFRGAKAIAISVDSKDQGGQPGLMYFDATTLQPIAFGGPDGKTAGVYKNVVLGAPMKAEEFAWTPPADAKSQDQMMKEALAAQVAAQAAQPGQAPGNKPAPTVAAAPDPTSHLLKDGSAAPDFTLKTPTGGTLTLSKSLGKRATIVNFWADFCGPCHAEMPLFVKLYKQLKSQGLELISVDDGDDAKTILKDAKEVSSTYLLAMNGKAKMNLLDLYGVDAFPTNYILDANGKIITTIVGFDEDALRAALKKAGFTLGKS